MFATHYGFESSNQDISAPNYRCYLCKWLFMTSNIATWKLCVCFIFCGNRVSCPPSIYDREWVFCDTQPINFCTYDHLNTSSWYTAVSQSEKSSKAD